MYSLRHKRHFIQYSQLRKLSKKMATENNGVANPSHQIRIVMQQCVSARLQLNATDGPRKEDPIYSNVSMTQGMGNDLIITQIKKQQ